MHIISLIGNNAGDKWSTIGLTTLIGLGMTFVMLALLILCIHLLRIILKALEKYNPKFKNFINNLLKKKKTNPNVNQNEPECISDSISQNNIDDNIKEAIGQSVFQYVQNSANDGKKHNKIKILSIEEVNND